MQEPQEYKLNGGERLYYVYQAWSFSMPTIFEYKVRENPTESRVIIISSSQNEYKVNRLGYKRDGFIYFQEIGGEKRLFCLLNDKLQDLIDKKEVFKEIKEIFNSMDLFEKISKEQLLNILNGIKTV